MSAYTPFLKPLAVAALVALCAIAVAGAAARAQLYAWHPEIVNVPCPLLGPATAVVYRDRLHVLFTCVDSRVFLATELEIRVELPLPPPRAFRPDPPACPIGFVRSRPGGCVPPDHPDAAR